jgi:uncharacterized protein (TIGR03437 family)
MKRTFSTLALALLVCAAVPAAVINTTLTVNATGTPSATFTSFAVAGTVSFTGGIGTGKIASTVPLDLTASSVVADYTITLDAGGSLTGKLAVPLSILGGGPATVTVTITGGTGTYSGATSGTSPIALTGTVSGDIVSGFKLTNFTSGTFTITTGGTPPPPVPTITAVQDAASNTPSIAQGSIFIVKGSNLSASGYTPFGPPRPTVSSGVKVTFTPVSGGGAGTDAYLVYLYNQSGVNQIACILPSTVAVGSYNVTVTNGTVSTPVVAQVVANKIGLFTQDSTGSGLASVQNYISQAVVDLNRLTTGSVNGVTISPAHPGQAVIAYGTGLGPLAAADNNPAVAYFDFSKSMTIQAIVGGVTIPVAYAGRAGYPGEDQINFTLPANISPGCAVTLQISVNGKLSAPTSIAIAPDANSTACVMPGYTTQQLTNFDNGGTYTTGYFSLTQFAMSIPSLGTEKVNSIAGAFSKITGFQLASAAQGNVSVIQSGSCQVIQSTSGGTTSASGTLITLDAGTVTINGPAGSSLTNQVLTKTDNSYSLTNIEGFSFPGQTNFSLPAGTYTLNGAGGNDVGTFNTSITLGSPLTLSSPLPDTVVRSAGLTVNWSGGNASDLVEIIGGTSTTTGTGSSAVTNSTSFLCLTTAGQRTFTVPASILTQLQPATTGSLIVASGVTPATFTASLKAGGSIDYGAFTSFVGIGGSPAYQ